jgi:hypothetical protein
MTARELTQMLALNYQALLRVDLPLLLRATPTKDLAAFLVALTRIGHWHSMLIATAGEMLTEPELKRLLAIVKSARVAAQADVALAVAPPQGSA